MGWVVNATPRPLYLRERPGTHCMGSWVSPSAGLDRCGNLAPTGIRSPDRMIVPNVSKIYNFLQSGIKTLRTSKPVTGNNISNCLSLSLSLSLLPNQTVRLWAQPCTLPFSGDQNILSLSEAVGGEASDPPQSNARIKNQRELYLYAFCIHSLCVNGHCTCTSTLKCWLLIDRDIKAAFFYGT